MANDSFYLKQIQVGPMENFVYLVGDPKTREALMVDPAWEVKRVLEVAKKDDYKVKGALVTHYHFDHTNGLEELLHATNGVGYINKNEAPFLKGLQGSLKKMDSGDKIQLGDLEITFLHTPGHTPGSQCFLIQNRLISGDTLFINACGRCDLPGGNAEQMYESLNRLSKLDENTILYPGHNYSDEKTSTIGQEKKNNPYMQFENMQNFLKHRMGV
jgi:glyoxylase-like metal-dependent hydrolase (beta-lactamase superfamily II)